MKPEASIWLAPLGAPMPVSVPPAAPSLPIGKPPEPVPLTLETQPIPEMADAVRELQRQIDESLRKAHERLDEQLAAQLRELEKWGLLDRVEGVTLDSASTEAGIKLTAQIRFRAEGDRGIP